MRVGRVSRNDYDNSSVTPVKMQKKQKINHPPAGEGELLLQKEARKTDG